MSISNTELRQKLDEIAQLWDTDKIGYPDAVGRVEALLPPGPRRDKWLEWLNDSWELDVTELPVRAGFLVLFNLL